jgi:hypothetical protein
MSRRIAAKKPFLSTTHIRKRKIWAREALKLTREEWIKIIWTDESSVEVGKESRESTVWRKPGERYWKECLVRAVPARPEAVSQARPGPI